MLEAALYIVGFLVVSFSFAVFIGAPYVPTLKRQVDQVLRLYSFGEKDVFVDIGSGDGVVLRVVAKQKAKAIGYEINPWLYVISKFLSRGQPNVDIHLANFWHASLPVETTVVYAFLNGRYMPKLKRKLEDHVSRTNKPLQLISFGFEMPDLTPLKSEGPMHLYQIKVSASSLQT